MAAIHLICGFMGFGKTTLAKKLEKELPAVRFTHDDLMRELYSRNLPDDQFRVAYKRIDNLIWELAEKTINAGANVILDYGFWSKDVRKKVNKRAKEITPDVYFHNVTCDVETAKKRVLNRTETDDKSLMIDENCFDIFWVTFEPVEEDEGLNIINHDGKTLIPEEELNVINQDDKTPTPEEKNQTTKPA